MWAAPEICNYIIAEFIIISVVAHKYLQLYNYSSDSCSDCDVRRHPQACRATRRHRSDGRLGLSTSSRLPACKANEPSAEYVYEDPAIRFVACRPTHAGDCINICSDCRVDSEILVASAPSLRGLAGKIQLKLYFQDPQLSRRKARGAGGRGQREGWHDCCTV